MPIPFTLDCGRPSYSPLAAITEQVWTLKDPQNISSSWILKETTGQQKVKEHSSKLQHATKSTPGGRRSGKYDTLADDDLSTSKKTSLSPDWVWERLPQAETTVREMLRKENFQIGLIIEAPLHEEDFMYGRSLASAKSTDQHNNKHAISASHYGYIHTKLRKFVVVALLQDHYLALPMYSHNSEGLEKKRDKNEYVSIHDVRNGNGNGSGNEGEGEGEGEGIAKLSDHEPLVTKDMRLDSFKLWRRTTVHVTYPISRNYHLRVSQLGSLTEESTKRLVQLFRTRMTLSTRKV